MAAKKTIVVMGATGAQGGGLVRAILTDPGGGFAVRAITRKPQSEKAAALAALGAEVVAADADQPASLEPAFKGAYGIFCITNFWEHFSPEREYTQAGAMARAAKAAGATHVIWSTLEDTRRWVPLSDNRMPTLMGKYKVPHFDAKGEADNLFRDLGVPTTFLLTSFYWDNLVYFGAGPKPGPDGKLALTFCMGDRPLPGIAVEDIGKCAYGIFRQGLSWIGKTPGLAGEHLTGTQMAAALTRALGREVVYNSITPDAYRALGYPGADDMGNMFQFKRDFNADFCAARDPRVARALNPDLMTFDAWLAKYRQKIPLE
jgi:uncharacterized protein YbjT (DUF2867 family)